MAGIVWWTRKRIGRLRRLARAGRPAAWIARDLRSRDHRLTAEAVRCAAARFGIGLRRDWLPGTDLPLRSAGRGLR